MSLCDDTGDTMPVHMVWSELIKWFSGYLLKECWFT